MLHSYRIPLFVLAFTLLLHAGAHGQQASGLAGAVKDASGALLPGVTVEAASPALIEKVRTVVTDGQGQYKIVDLRPGTYVVTFTVPGFTTVKREGIELTAGFTATVDAEMRVGAFEEAVTVTAASPLVDTQNVRQQKVIADGLLGVPRDNDVGIAPRGSEQDVSGAYNSAFSSTRHTGRRTSLIVDPPDGRIPPMTADAQKRRRAIREFELALLQATDTCRNKLPGLRGWEIWAAVTKARRDASLLYRDERHWRREYQSRRRPGGSKRGRALFVSCAARLRGIQSDRAVAMVRWPCSTTRARGKDGSGSFL